MTDDTDSHPIPDVDRRTALKGGAAGLAALGMGGFATSNAAAHHKDGHGDDDGGGSGGDNAANQFRFAGEEWTVMEASSNNGNNCSPPTTLLRMNEVKQSNSWQDSLLLFTSLESSLLTEVKVSGGEDTSRSVAGVLGWVEIKGSDEGEDAWRMITADDETAEPPTRQDIVDVIKDQEQGLEDLAKGVVAFNTRDFELEWDLMELIEQAMLEVIQAIDELREIYDDIDDYYNNRVSLDGSFDEHETGLVDDGMDPGIAQDFIDSLKLLFEDEDDPWAAYQQTVADAEDFDALQDELLDLEIFLRAYLKTKSANGFNWLTTGTAGTHDVRLQGVLAVFVDEADDEDVQAQAVVGSRTMIAQPVKIKASVDSRSAD